MSPTGEATRRAARRHTDRGGAIRVAVDEPSAATTDPSRGCGDPTSPVDEPRRRAAGASHG